MLIDFSSRPPLPEFQQSASHLANYRRVYRSSEAESAKEASSDDFADYLATYDAVDARRIVIKARDLTTTFGFRIANEDVARLCAAHDGRFVGFAGVDPHKGEAAVAELRHAVEDLGLRGLNLQCFEHRLRPNDPRMFPLYQECVRLRVPVNIHCGVNFSTESLLDFGRPAYLDEVACAFPTLDICASPPGWPWVQELIAVAWRHRRLRIGIVSVRPNLLTRAHAGYEPLLLYGGRLLQDQIIFGSGFPMLPIARTVAELDALPLDEAVRHKWKYQNAAEFLRL
jgi:predicted TIM-barrel fold metal-dependent hydrolase